MIPIPNLYRKSLLLFIACCLQVINSTAQLNANFTASVQSGCSPVVVQFTDASTGNPTEWFWDLGNGVTSTQQNPGTIYISPGSYNVKLRIKNGTGQDSVTKTGYITVYSKPVVNFTASPTSGCAPLNVIFKDLSTANGGTITGRQWDFGDGTTSTAANPGHVYSIQNIFDVSLTVTNSFGCRQTLLQKKLIDVGGIVTADFSYTYSNVCKPPAVVTFKNLSTVSGPATYQWNFGDGTNSTLTDPVHTYLTSGNFKVTLITRNSSGCTDTSKQVINIGGAKADFNFTKNVCIGEPVFFTDTSSPKPKSVTWNFGDGSTGTGLSVSHTYTKAGTYQVTETADFGGCTDVTKKNIVITGKPTASFTGSGDTATCNYPVTIQFTNTSSAGVNFEWQFGDGTTSNLPNPSHTYTAAGNYSVTLIVFNSNGCGDTLTKTGLVQLGPPEITGIQNLPASGCAPLTVLMRPVVVSAEPIVSYKWAFGDGTFSTDSVPTHVYSNVGGYTVGLIVTTSSGCADTLIITDAVLVGRKPKPGFYGDPLTVCAQDGIQFTDTSKGNITDWFWEFGDGGTSTEQNPFHQFADTGYQTIKLTVSSNGCSDSVSFVDYVYIDPPIALYSFASLCADPFLVNFSDSSIGATTWLWDFGDGTTSNIPSPSHRYSTPGIYKVSLTVTNGTCSYINRDTVDLFDEKPLFDYVPLQTNFCKYDSVKFFVTSYNPSRIQLYYWDFGDSSNTGFGPSYDTVYHVYTSSGTYTPTLIVQDTKGCYDTVSNKLLQLKINGPVAAFSNKNGECVKTSVLFTDESYGDTGSPITEWIWNYGDTLLNDTLSSGPFSHTYTTTGAFDVFLKVTDINGCSDSVLNEKAVQITNSRALFGVDGNTYCPGSPVQFLDSSKGSSIDYYWQFGDGGNSANPAPEHVYVNEGVYDVSLKITDKYGCADSLLKPAYITVTSPVAKFVNPDTLFQCPPASVAPQNTSSGYASLMWDFGDGNTSSEINPVHIYTEAGNFNLMLIAYGYGNCADTFTKPLILKGPEAVLRYDPFKGCNPLTVSFGAASKNAKEFVWDFGNGITQAGSDTALTYIYTEPGIYVPKLVVVDSGGCRVAVENKDTVVVYGVAAKYGVAQDLNTCDSVLINFADSSTVFGDNITARSWDFGDGSTSALDNPSHYYKQSGIYNTVLTITTQNGCTSSYTLPLDITVHDIPDISALIPDSACAGAYIPFEGTLITQIKDSVTWVWNTGTDTVHGMQAGYIFNTSGIYTVKLTASTAFGCENTVSQPVKINPSPLTDAGPDSVICLGQSLLLQPSGADFYTWANNSFLSCTDCKTPLAVPSLTDTFYVTGANVYGCRNTDSVFVEVKQPASILVNPADTICVGNAVQIKASGAELYNWQPASGLSNPFSAETTASPGTTTTYSVIGEDSKRCFSDTGYVTVTVFPYPVINLPDSIITIESGTSYQVNATGTPDIVRWQWMPPDGLSCNACPQPEAQPRTDITYKVTAYNAAGCATVKSLTIQVLCKNGNLYIPNTFSPNGDGMNDYFYPRGKGLFTIKSLRVFNRWGKIVFEKMNFAPNYEKDGWDGKYNGAVLQPDVYVYVTEVVCENGSVIFSKGNITLLR